MACRNGRHYKIIVVSAILSTITGSESRGKNGCYVNFKSRYIALLFLRTISSINMNGILTLSVNSGDEVEEDDQAVDGAEVEEGGGQRRGAGTDGGIGAAMTEKRRAKWTKKYTSPRSGFVLVTVGNLRSRNL